MGRLIVEQIVTADGFAQDSDGGMKFMESAPISATDTEQLSMLESVGAVVLGRRTYEMFSEYWPDVSPEDQPVAALINSLPKHVVSATLESAPWGSHAAAIVESGGALKAVQRLQAEADGDVLVWGSLELTDALFMAGMVDVLRLRGIPVLIGSGRVATPAGLEQTTLRQVASHATGGWVTTEYALS